INTRALILLDQTSGAYYLRLLGRWMGAASIEGPWTVAPNPPASLAQAQKTAVAAKQVDLLDQKSGNQTAESAVPTVYVSTVPAELLQTQGRPGFAPIDGTRLLTIKNTSSRIFLDLSSQRYYVLISGRWFRARSLPEPWEYVPAGVLPPDFAKIPENHPKGDVLMSVAGTPQAKEAVIANSVPQTATVKRSEANLDVAYDGQPEFKPIESTKLEYAVNTAVPVIRVSDNAYYAVRNGVWFAAATATGPWAAASAVPGEIYTIPPSSPLYYVTYVHVYGATPEVIYTGYQPGYLGTCVSEDAVVVYGTGYVYPPWVGAVWYGPPVTYGFGVSFGFAAGFAFGFDAGYWGGPWWGPYWGHPGWGGNVYVNHVNVYNHWNRNVIVQRTPLAPHPVSSGHTAHGDVYAGRDGKVYRRQDASWQHYEGKDGWKTLETASEKDPEARPENRPEEPAREVSQPSENSERLDQEERARARGEDHESFSRGGGGGESGGFHGGGGESGGSHGGGGGRR
ncbi:MAG: carbohydrate-binding family V/XII, partial [Candidatus Aureabacteria bacterium]|nr:carbohydrate-binding family V/XII [Candidatus Auribacterota bacterium]